MVLSTRDGFAIASFTHPEAYSRLLEEWENQEHFLPIFLPSHSFYHCIQSATQHPLSSGSTTHIHPTHHKIVHLHLQKLLGVRSERISMAAAEKLSVGMVGGGDGVVSGSDGVISGGDGVVSGREGGVKESEVVTSVLEGERRVEGECNEGCGVTLRSILEAIEDLKRCFVSEVNELKSVVKKQEIEIRSFKCGDGGPSGVSGGAHARDVPGGVTEGDVPRATTY
ncbi:hypothetical protein GWK47_023544 [Chionoecetes opilio]|uniref:Uncharacterized protein n=1 Tax=Chionoecetes opilio TaxID=41210 RepID=A0A8J4XM80_CHIOP|nr:hypothetical protein GWK47_023544 [Chionoecetes opilio]